jgi:hypothetical protein
MGGIREYNFDVSVETSQVPAGATPSADADLVPKLYADNTYTPKAQVLGSLADITAVKAVASANRVDGQVAFCQSNSAFYKFSSSSVAAGDDDLVLVPASGSGRWLKATGSAAASGGGAGIELVAMVLSNLKQSLRAELPNDNILAEAFMDPNALTMTVNLAKDYTAVSDTTTIYLDVNKTAVDSMDATTGWTASVGSVASDGTNKLEGTNSNKHTVTTLNGSGNISKALAFSLIDKLFRCRVYLDTVTNLTRLTIKLETSVGNDATYYFPVAGLVAGWNFLTVDPTATPDATTGTWSYGNITKVYLGLTTGASQTLNASWDDLIIVDRWPLVNSLQGGRALPIWDNSNQEIMIIASETATSGEYTLASALSNNYTRAAASVKPFGGIVNTEGLFESGSGVHAKQQHFIKRKLLAKNMAGKTLKLMATMKTDIFPVTSFASSTSLTIAGDYSGRFKNGDKIVLFKYESDPRGSNGPEYSSFYNSVLGSNFKVLTLSQDSSYGAPSTTITHSPDSNSTGGDTSNWSIVRLSVVLKYFVGSLTASESLTTAAITDFLLLAKYTYFSDTFTAADSTTPANYNGWATGYSNGGGVDIQSGAMQLRSGGAGTYQSVYRAVEAWTTAKFPLEISFEMTNTINNAISVFNINYGHTGGTSIGDIFNQSANCGLTWECGLGASPCTVRLFNGASYLAAAANLPFNTQAAPGVYKFRIQHWPTFSRIKVWRGIDSEPAAWSQTVSYTSVSLAGNRFAFGTTMGSTGYANIDNLKITTIGGEITMVSEITSQSGQKMVIDAMLDRQDTTNDIPSLVKFGGILV